MRQNNQPSPFIFYTSQPDHSNKYSSRLRQKQPTMTKNQPGERIKNPKQQQQKGGNGNNKKSGGGEKKQQKNPRTLSRAMSWALRHAAPELGLTMSSDGYVPVNDLLNCGHARFRGWNEDDVRNVVETNDKQRFKLSLRPAKEFRKKKDSTASSSSAEVDQHNDTTILCIRANQGHSIPHVDAEKLLTKIKSTDLENMDTIIHGTNLEAWERHISNEGLSRMTRNHIHFARGMPEEDHVISGMRKSCEVYIYVDGKACADANIEFYRSDNEVLLTAGLDNKGILPVKFFSRVISSSGKTLFQA